MIALIGASGSGKSALGLHLARKFDLEIFSLDSLSIYKYIDIASAKPKRTELDEIKHYGINLLNPNQKCHAGIFYNLLDSLKHKKNLIIIGGSSFYLKSMISGLSNMPLKSHIVEQYLKNFSQDKRAAFEILRQIDKESSINPNDSFRLQKHLEIYLLTKCAPSEYFKKNPPKKMDIKIDIFELIKPKNELKIDIAKRCEKMFSDGLINEVENLIKNYPNSPALRAIGIKEIIDFLHNKINKNEAKELIIKNTIALAKRQRTFNKTQFGHIAHLEFEILKNELESYYQNQGKK